MPAKALMAIPAPVANLQQYTQLVHTFPTLNAEQELALAQQYRRDNDLDAAWQMVKAHLRYVIHIARGYSGYGLPADDLIQEGNIGLMKAVRRYDPSRGVRLATYATYWIRAHIHDFILKNWRIVKVATTKSKRKLFYKLRSARKKLNWLKADEIQDLASAWDVRTDDVLDMESVLYSNDVAFDQHSGEQSTDAWTPDKYLSAPDSNPEALVCEHEFSGRATETLRSSLSELDERSRTIIEQRWLVDNPDAVVTLQELGERYGVSAERIRQIETRAMQQLGATVKSKLGIQQ